MRTGWRLLADAVALTHGAAVVLLVAGPFLFRRHRWLPWLHAPVAVAILAVNRGGADCPLTTAERELRRLAGARAYDGGFLDHYLIRPVHPAGITPAVELAVSVVATVPSVAGYVLLAARARRRRSVQPVTR